MSEEKKKTKEIDYVNDGIAGIYKRLLPSAIGSHALRRDALQQVGREKCAHAEV